MTTPSTTVPPPPPTIDDATAELSYGDQQQLEQILRDGWKFTPATMAHKITGGRWIPARHLMYISTKVATAIAKGGARIVMTMPARHGKSEFLSVNTPIWFLETWAQRYVMILTYASDLAEDFSLKVRDTFEDPELHHLLSTRVRRTKRKVNKWLTTAGGGVTAAGIGGPITGRGADLMLIDDYIKNAVESLSASQRKSTWEWFKSTAYTRLEPGGSLIVLATRWNSKDLIASLLHELPHENWELINLPAIAEINDPLGREVGEALWPERYSVEALRRIQLTLGDYWWKAMYQQHPKSSMSGMDLGDKLRIIPESELPHYTLLRYMRVWDLASTKDGGDWTVGMKLGYCASTGRVYLTDVIRVQESSARIEQIILETAELDSLGCEIWMEQEPGSAGVAVIDHYRDTILRGYTFNGEKATGHILVRAQPFTAGIEAGRVYAVEAEWNEDLKDELNGFGEEADHDDQIVAGALGYHKLVKNRFGGLVWGRSSSTAKNRIIDIHTGQPIEAAPARSSITWGGQRHE